MNSAHRTLLRELLALPTSPLNEQYVAEYIRAWAAKRPGLELTADRFGNLRLRMRVHPEKQRSRRRDAGATPGGGPIVFSAHMDHPGFEAERMTGGRRVRAIWRGGVLPEYFDGARVRFFTRGKWVRGRITSVRIKSEGKRKRVESVTAEVAGPVEAGAIGMWDLPEPRVRGSRLYARACDDLAGAAAILAAFDALRRRRGPIDVCATFTRTEEVGFAGALAGARTGLYPKGARVVAVEISSELPGVRMGGGPILRVGDASAVFTPHLTAFCRTVAEDLARRDRRFRFQRKLMDGGTCESAAFCAYGLEATGLCLALGNYHNMDRERRRIGAEYIDLNDFDLLVKWFVALATTRRVYAPRDVVFDERLARLDRTWTPQLERTAHKMG